jgi:hypothetical protein
MIKRHPRLVYAAVVGLGLLAAVGGFFEPLGCSW